MVSNDHLLISYPVSFDGQLSVDIEKFGFAITKRVQVNKYKSNKHTASSHDFMYAVVSYVIFKPFIGSFRKELGSKKAKSLTSLLSHIFKKIKKKRVITYSYNDIGKLDKLLKKYPKKKKQFKRKVGKIGSLCPPVAIRIKLDKHTVDFIFPADMQVKGIKKATAGMQQILTDQKNYQGRGSILYVFRGGQWVAEETRHLML